jgi:hypothetical protein
MNWLMNFLAHFSFEIEIEVEENWIFWLASVIKYRRGEKKEPKTWSIMCIFVDFDRLSFSNLL